MKRQFTTMLALALCLACLLSLFACNKQGGGVETPEGNENEQTEPGVATPTGVWGEALYLSNQEFGTGEKTIEVEVSAEGQAITFVVHTDKEMLGDALLECGLIAGDPGPYGLYVKRANGMLADYDVNKHYWSFSKSGTGLMTGVDMEPIEDGAHYEITYAK